MPEQTLVDRWMATVRNIGRKAWIVLPRRGRTLKCPHGCTKECTKYITRSGVISAVHVRRNSSSVGYEVNLPLRHRWRFVLDENEVHFSEDEAVAVAQGKNNQERAANAEWRKTHRGA